MTNGVRRALDRGLLPHELFLETPEPRAGEVVRPPRRGRRVPGLHCRPDEAKREAAELARLLEMLETDAPPTPRALAAESGLDAPTIRRLLCRGPGVSVRV